MVEKKGSSATRAKNKYNEKAYDRLYIMVPKGIKEKIKEASDISINAYVLEALEAKYKADTGEELL